MVEDWEEGKREGDSKRYLPFFLTRFSPSSTNSPLFAQTTKVSLFTGLAVKRQRYA